MKGKVRGRERGERRDRRRPGGQLGLDKDIDEGSEGDDRRGEIK